MMEIDLKNKVILVTGVSRGIGKAIAKSLAESDATIAVHFNKNKDKAQELAENLGNNSKPFQADLSNPKNAEKLFQEVLKTYKKVDVLVNNAGIFVKSPVEVNFEKWLENWNKTINVNLTSPGILCHEAINHFKQNSGGRIINIASRAAFRGETEEYLAYAASKGGLVSLSRSIARSFGKYNIKSFVIAPGFVRTDMAKDYLEIHEKEMIENELSLNEITEPEDIAPVVVLMVSGKMDHATGSIVDINAGSYMR